MCLMVYLGSDAPLPRIPRRDEASLCILDLHETEEAVRAHFGLNYLCTAGTNEGCGCGFQFGQYEGLEDPDDVAAARARRQTLADYLSEQLKAGRKLELYACWAGEEAEPPSGVTDASVNELTSTRTYFAERELLRLA